MYKVPCSPFDYAPSSLDPVLVDRHVKEPDDHKLPNLLLTQFERDARTIYLVSSFMDMTGAAAGRIVVEALRNEHLPQEAKHALQGVGDLEQTRGHAVSFICLHWHQHLTPTLSY